MDMGPSSVSPDRTEDGLLLGIRLGVFLGRRKDRDLRKLESRGGDLIGSHALIVFFFVVGVPGPGSSPSPSARPGENSSASCRLADLKGS